MKHFLTLLIIILFTGVGANAQSFATDSAAAVRVLLIQQEAWNNGDIDGFMQGYWNSDSLQFVSPKGMTLGYERVLNNYKRAYPDTKAMKELRFGIIRVIQPANNVVQITGRWDLLDNGASASGGYFTLLLKRFPEGWKIIADHTN